VSIDDRPPLGLWILPAWRGAGLAQGYPCVRREPASLADKETFPLSELVPFALTRSGRPKQLEQYRDHGGGGVVHRPADSLMRGG
jgi:hypothetical protein